MQEHYETLKATSKTSRDSIFDINLVVKIMLAKHILKYILWKTWSYL